MIVLGTAHRHCYKVCMPLYQGVYDGCVDIRTIFKGALQGSKQYVML